jgi:hypothetical protein
MNAGMCPRMNFFSGSTYDFTVFHEVFSQSYIFRRKVMPTGNNSSNNKWFGYITHARRNLLIGLNISQCRTNVIIRLDHDGIDLHLRFLF